MEAEYIPLVVFACVVPIIWSVSAYNKFIAYKNSIEEAWSGIDVALKRRFNLIPTLAHAVRLYSNHEADSLQQVTQQRVGSSNIEKRATEESEVSRSLQGMLAVAEAYPDLKASENFAVLQNALNEVEKEIAAARTEFNAAVRRLNTHVQSFPSNLIAKAFNFKEAQYFSLELATEREAPRLSPG
jgi:LemA protein